MRTLVHLSDLHFGRVNPAILDPLLVSIHEVQPDLVAISGDLTQRAHTDEFEAAHRFLKEIPFRKIVVPGNHDVPLYNVFSRFVRRLRRYRRYICDDLAPFHADAEIAVAGVNTARAFTFKDGRINAEQIAELQANFQKVTGEQTRVVVSHHPFDLPEGVGRGRVVGRAAQAMAALAECHVDLVLAGHFHVAHTGSSATRFRIPGYSALLVSAGTTTSTRGRGQANSFNVIRLDRSRIDVECWAWQAEPAHFVQHSVEKFGRTTEGWAVAA